MKKNIKAILIAVCVISAIIAAYFFCQLFFLGKIDGDYKFADAYYAGTNLQGVVSIYDSNKNYYKNGKLQVTILDKDGKKIKNGKTNIKFEDSHLIPVSIPLDDGLENGNYSLKISYRHGVIKEEGEIDFRIKGNKSQKTIISLDKGIYKPGDSIKYRVLMISEGTSIPISSDVTVEIFDGNDNKVYSETSKTSEYGIVSGSFGLADEVNSGDYKLVVKKGTYTETKVFKVNPYVEPKYSLTITPDKDFYIYDTDTAHITVDAQYFFGEPVKGATVTLKATDLGFEKTVYTDDSGKAVFDIEIKDVKLKHEKLEVTCVDTSNYSIEENATICMGMGQKSLEVFSDYGENVAISGLNNKIYFILKDERDNPIKTFGNINVGDKIKRDFITDEAGLGSISLSATDLEGLTSNVSFEMTFKDGEVNSFISSPLTIKEIKGLFLRTDKIKYKDGEKIEVSLNETVEKRKFLYVTKNDTILQIIPITSDKIEFTLEPGISGLINLFVSDMDYVSTPYSYYSKRTQVENAQKIDSNKKTIFVESSKGLTIGINTDKEQYGPSDKINISFNVADKESNGVDAAMLVSILDEAILSLADNDLSIDNIMLDLGDIELTEGMSLADLYAIILNDSDETELNAILLRQNSLESEILPDGSQPLFSKSFYDTSAIFVKAVLFAAIAVIVLSILIYRCINKESKAYRVFTTVFESGLAVLTIFAVLQLTLYEFLEDFAYENISYNHSELIAVLINVTLSIVAYLLLLYKYRRKIVKGIVELVIVPLTFMALLTILGYFNLTGITVLVVCVLLLLYAIGVAIARKGNKKILSIFGKTGKALVFILKALVKSVIFYLIIAFGDGNPIAFIIAMAIYVLIPVAFGKKKDININDGKWIMNFTKGEVIGFGAGIAFLFVIIAFLGLMHMVTHFASNVNSDDEYDYIEDVPTYRRSGGFEYETSLEDSNEGASSSQFNWSDAAKVKTVTKDASDTTGASASINSISNIFNKSFGQNVKSDNTNVEDYYEETEVPLDSSEINTASSETTTEKIRNIFVESLAFIPELVVENGKTTYEMNLSDNITTWNIQVVANTKDGNLGYGSKQFKVFKELFTDVSLPTNAVEGDKVSLPVTVYNYTEAPMSVHINIPANDWCTIGAYQTDISVEAKNTKMIYVPIDISKQGEHVLRVEATANGKSDIVEKSLKVNYKGLEQTVVSANGSADGTIDLDILFDKTNVISGSEKIKVKLYPSIMSIVLTNVDSMIKLPTGCFEQTSSSLYPDILILKYLEDKNMDTPELRAKLDDYISKGYQKLLTYEVKGEPGGYSLYGNNPAETVITAFGLMEFNELKDVYEVDEAVIEEMKEFIYSKQNFDGSFDYNSTYIGSAANTSDDAMIAYIAWGLSEVDPTDKRLSKTEDYLEKAYKKNMDGYTLALIANVFQNTGNNEIDDVLSKIKDLAKEKDTDKAYIQSTSRDYYGSYGSVQDLQATALTSIALSRSKIDSQLNKKLINYIFSEIDERGTWRTTQATILGLKALNEANENSGKVSKKLTATFNGETQELDLSEKNALDTYELEFTNISEQNKIKLDLGNEKMRYEVVREYYINYPTEKINEGIDVSYSLSGNSIKVNDRLTQFITVKPGTPISNMLVKVDIPQGFSVDETSLLNLKYKGIIEKYEYNYGKINLYLRNVGGNDYNLDIVYKANYPVNITGGAVEAYDYYNVSTRGYSNPTNIVVNQ